MSREVHRVPTDFDWPIGTTWEGFLMPDTLGGNPCPDCQGGQTHAAWWLQRFCQRLTMLAADIADQERGRRLHPWLARDQYPHGRWVDGRYEVVRPSADIRVLMEGLCGPAGFMGDWSGRDHKLFGAIVKAAGLEHWGACETCDGEGTLETYPGQRAEAEAWEPTPPPEGDGWQLWEDVSEGSPISPVFATAEGLAGWMSTEYVPVGGGRMSFESALRFIGVGWAPSFVFSPGTGLVSGEQFAGRGES